MVTIIFTDSKVSSYDVIEFEKNDVRIKIRTKKNEYVTISLDEVIVIVIDGFIVYED